MSDPVDLNARRMKMRGEPMFAHCGCGSHGWHVVCVMATDKPVVSALVCMLCELRKDVVYGVVHSSAPEAE